MKTARKTRLMGDGMKNRFIFILILIFVFLPLGLMISCNKKTNPSVEILTEKKILIRITVEVADTFSVRQQGLMYRDSLGENAGMLFIMPSEQIQNFWMKNTKIPLDIIFIFSDWKIAGIIENTKPYSEENVSIDKPTRFVLEVNAGFCKKHGIQAGDKVIYHPIQ